MSAPTSYTELAEMLDRLPFIVADARRARGLSLRRAAHEIGISFSTVTRVEQGEDVVLSTITAVLRWLDQSHT